MVESSLEDQLGLHKSFDRQTDVCLAIRSDRVIVVMTIARLSEIVKSDLENSQPLKNP